MRWTSVISDLNGEEIAGTFYKKELQKKKKNTSELKNQSRENEVNYMSQKRYNNSFNIWIDKKDIV